jgi:hypothetical protein
MGQSQAEAQALIVQVEAAPIAWPKGGRAPVRPSARGRSKAARLSALAVS